MFGLFNRNRGVPSGLDVHDTSKASRASMFAMHIMALADGVISPEEREAMIEITSSFKRGLLSPEGILDLVDETQKLFAGGGEEAWKYLFETTGPFHRTDQFFIAHTALTFAIIDGEFHAREQRMLGLLCQWIGMNKRDTRDFLLQVDERLEQEAHHGRNIQVDRRDWRIT